MTFLNFLFINTYNRKYIHTYVFVTIKHFLVVKLLR